MESEMKCAVTEILIFILISSSGQTVTEKIDSAFIGSLLDYEDYSRKPLIHYDLTDNSFREEEARMRKQKEQRFIDALMMEAGRHFLYPTQVKQPADVKEKTIDTETEKFNEMSGQPEYTDLGMSRSERGSEVDRDQSCSQECSEYNPVCGTDGKVYSSYCQMLKLNCRFPNVSIADWEMCRGRHFLCPANCLSINDPVCGDDGHIYKNICIMRWMNCGHLIQTRPMKHCYAKSKDENVYGPCPEDCQEIYKPVCGSDGKVYNNECFMRMRTCGEDIQVRNMEECAEESDCPGTCLSVHAPVCGSDGKLYLNYCKMRQENCGRKDVKRMPTIYCLQSGSDETAIRVVKKENA